MSYPVRVKITSFKPSGKYYASIVVVLDSKHTHRKTMGDIIDALSQHISPSFDNLIEDLDGDGHFPPHIIHQSEGWE